MPMKVHEIPAIRVLIKSYQNKAEKPTMKQSIQMLNIKVMAAIIKQDGKIIKQAGAELCQAQWKLVLVLVQLEMFENG